MKPLVLAAPEPRTLPHLFAPDRLRELHDRYTVLPLTEYDLPRLADDTLARARYLLGQPALDEGTAARMPSLRAVLNVEGNLLPNLPYDLLLARGVHVLVANAVFALPVAEMGLGMALSLLRGIHGADRAMREGRETWGLESNASARLLSGSTVGILGLGLLGQALARLLQPFGVRLLAHDPWQAPSVTRAHGAEPVGLDAVLSEPDTLFVTAAVTGENQGVLGRDRLARLRPGAALILLSRAAVVDFDALMDAVEEGRILAATDVFPEEPLPPDHRARRLPGLLLSAHRAGALASAFHRMGEMCLEDMDLMDRGLPPQVMRRAERETVGRLRSRPVARS